MDKIFERIKNGEKTVIIGIGNRLRTDDGAGSIIVEKLKEKIKKENIIFIDAEIKIENYIGIIKKISPSFILIIDTIDFGSFPGDFKIFKIEDLKDTTISTHNLSIPLLKKLINDKEILLFGIQPKNLNFGEGLSLEVKNSIEKIIKYFEDSLI
ncbi:MAG: hydrogenase maturation protease [Candidatus Ratteibacteria bacterium]